MPDFDISGRQHHHQQFEYGDKEKANISIKHTTGHHSHNITQRDMIQASTTAFQEEYVPPVDTPVLEPYDQNASNEPPKSKREKPGAKFKSNFENELQRLPAHVLKSIASTPHEARAMLRFAHANPDVPMDPKVRALLKTIVKEATQETREQMNLGSDWKPPQPHKGQFNAHISDRLNSNFESLLKENFSGADYKSLRLAYYHPELRNQLSPELKDYLKEMTKTAYDETQNDMGFPEGWQPPPDSSALDDVVNGHFTHTFDEQVAKQKDLTAAERKELRTLFRFPNAKLPDKEKLQELLKSLTDKAHASAKERFGLPSDFKLSHQSHIFKAAIKGSFGHQFQKEVLKKLRNGEISHEQAQKLLASKGTDPAKLPSNLQNVYTQARQTAAKQTASEMGLPENWQPTEESSDTPPGQAGTTQQGTVRNADGSVRIQANTPVRGKGLHSQQSQPIDPLTAPASNRDTNTSLKAINYFNSAVNATSKITATYFTGPEHMFMGDAMQAVSDALSNLRESVYAIQVAEARAAREVSRGQNDAQEEKIRKELADMMKAPPKQFFLFKILRVIPIVKEFAKKIEDAVKLLMWAVNIVTGGAVSMITQAINMQPIEENPLHMLGMISEEAAKKMDMALGIIVMVAEMAVSAVLAQPELVMAEVAALTAELSEATASTAIRTVAKVTGEATEKLAAPAIRSGARVVTREAFEATVKEAVEKALPEIMEHSMQQVGKVSAKQAAKQAVNQSIRAQAKAFVRKVFDKAKEIATRQVKQQIKRVQNIKREITELPQQVMKAVDDPMGFARNQVQEFTGQFGKATGKAGSKADDAIDATKAVDGAEGAGTQGERAAQSAAERAEGKAAEGAEKQIEKQADELTEVKEPRKETETTSSENPSSSDSQTAEKAGGKETDAADAGKGDSGSDGKEGVSSDRSSLNEQKAEVKEPAKKDPEPQQKEAQQTDRPDTQDQVPEENVTNPEEPNVADEAANAEQAGGKDLDPEIQNKMDASKQAKFKETYKSVLEDAMKRSIERQLKEQGVEIERAGFKQAMKEATQGKAGFEKAVDGFSAGKNWVETEVKEAVKTGMKKAAEATKMDKVANKLDDVTDKIGNKLGDTKVGKVVTNIAERFASSDSLIKQAAKELEKGSEESLQHAQRKLLKASAKRMVERNQSNIRFMMDIKDYMQNTIQFASYTAQTIMYFKKADAAMKAAENAAFIQEMDAYIEMDKKAEDALLQSMGDLAGWINDINQQESTFWKKMEIRFIAA